MTLRRLFIVLVSLSAAATPGFAQEGQPSVKPPKNIIFMIGDGMGNGQISAAGLSRELRIEKCPVIGLVKTQSATSYVTDSAAAGTALATGVRTINGRLGLDPEEKPLNSLIDSARETGRATGIVVTSEITHATPAAFVARNLSRMKNLEIAVDFVERGPDVFIGTGLEFFKGREDGRDLVGELKAKGYEVTETKTDYKEAKGPKLAALLGPGRLPEAAKRGPILQEATAKALEILEKSPNGFFLMVEGSQIDWACHANEYTRMLEEVYDFDATVAVVLDWAAKNGETLVVITADHETGGLDVVGGAIADGPSEGAFASKHHTGSMVPLFAEGVEAGRFAGVYKNTDVFKRLDALMRAKAK